MLLALIIVYVMSLVYISTVERFRVYATLISLQGWVLLGIALLRLHTIDWLELSFVVFETLVFKAIIVPFILFRVIEKTGVNRVHKGAVSIFNSLLMSFAALIASIGLTYFLADQTVDMIFFGVSIYAAISGLVLITTHKRIFAHLVGFLVLENGVFLFAMAAGIEMPFLINIAILLDILISILLLGMFMSKIGDKLHNLNADELTSIKD